MVLGIPNDECRMTKEAPILKFTAGADFTVGIHSSFVIRHSSFSRHAQ